MSKTGDWIIKELRELPENQGRVCGQCFFWRLLPTVKDDQIDNHTGRCRRFPPAVETMIINAFPVVPDNEWCGEWKPIESLVTTRPPTGMPE